MSANKTGTQNAKVAARKGPGRCQRHHTRLTWGQCPECEQEYERQRLNFGGWEPLGAAGSGMRRTTPYAE